MPHALQSRIAVTGQMPIDYAIKLGELAESLNITRHKLTVRTLLVGLEIAAAQIRAETAAKATHQPPAAVKE